MSFKIYIRDGIGNEIHNVDPYLPKVLDVANLNITDGMLIKGNYRIPVEHILFIQEIL